MDVYGAVLSRLAMLGYLGDQGAYPGIDYMIAKCETKLLADINHKTLPDGLFYTLVDMVAGSILHERLAAGDLEIDGLDFSQQPKSITEGDIKVDFAGASDGVSSAEARFRSKLDDMMHPPERILGAYRRMRW